MSQSRRALAQAAEREELQAAVAVQLEVHAIVSKAH